MIKEVTIRNFKRFRNETFVFRPDGVTLLAGGNNSGKSTILQALAVWEFCRSLISATKGRSALNAGVRRDPVGVNAEEFSPIALPSLVHLWTNLNSREGYLIGERDPAYTLRIGVKWDVPAPVVAGQPPGAVAEHELQIGMTLTHERVYVKPTRSTLGNDTPIPHLAYLPPFAGIQTREERMSPAAQKRLIGRGVAGATLRNVLHDLKALSDKEFTVLRHDRRRIPVVEQQQFFRRDPWRQLADVLERVFNAGLLVQPFDEWLQTALHVDVFRGDYQGGKFQKFPNFTPRDIMVEGSGFLQWLSVYALAVTRDINVLLLDEPDAHLHPSLQAHLMDRLRSLARENRKQVLLATHSTEILRQVDHRCIYELNKRGHRYLTLDQQRVGLFAGLGSEYSPKIDQLRKSKRVVFVEGTFDEAILRAFATKINKVLSEDLVFWQFAGDHKQRRVLFAQLRGELPGLEGMSLRDRDELALAQVGPDLKEHNHADGEGLRFRTWRRRHFENYLLFPAAISRAAIRSEEEIRTFLVDTWGVPVGVPFVVSDCVPGLLDARGKEALYEGKAARNGELAKVSVEVQFGCVRHDIAGQFRDAEVPDDVRLIVGELRAMCQIPLP
jgi:energy-coupling factor transporter ATP-binding protein EcfA2